MVERSLVLRPERVVQVEYLLNSQAAVLPDVRVNELPEYGGLLSGFGQRRKLGFGTFFDETEIRQREFSRLSDLLRKAQGIRLYPDQGRHYAVSSRQTMIRASRPGDARFVDCFMQIYVDGALFWRGRSGDPTSLPPHLWSDPPPDLSSLMPLSDIAAIEVYAGTAGLPPEFRGVGTNCGIVLIWTKRGGNQPVGS